MCSSRGMSSLRSKLAHSLLSTPQYLLGLLPPTYTGANAGTPQSTLRPWLQRPSVGWDLAARNIQAGGMPVRRLGGVRVWVGVWWGLDGKKSRGSQCSILIDMSSKRPFLPHRQPFHEPWPSPARGLTYKHPSFSNEEDIGLILLGCLSQFGWRVNAWSTVVETLCNQVLSLLNRREKLEITRLRGS